MKKLIITIAAVLSFGLVSTSAAEKEQKPEPKNHFKLYGFVRNYFVFDSRESVSGTGDLFYYLPKDVKFVDGIDIHNTPSLSCLALTSRLGVDVSGYSIGNVHFGAKIEGDFYAGLSNSTNANAGAYFSGNTKISGTAQARLRQAYATVTWKDLPFSEKAKASVALKMGQAWHPMAADFPHLFSLEVGAPFGPFSRTPLVQMDATLGNNWVVSGAAIWQMQYQSNGPIGNSASYMKYGMTPEVYAAVAYKTKGFLVRAGVDLLSIKPRVLGTVDLETSEAADNQQPITKTVRVSDRKTSILYYIYAQYSKGKFGVKAKSTYGQGGEHMNLMSGYAKVGECQDGSWIYESLRNTSSWVSFSYGKKWQAVLFLGYIKNLGLAEKVNAPYLSKSDVYFCSNGFSNLNQMYRVNPQVIYNIGKLNVGLEYQWTHVQYGDYLNGKYEIAGKFYEIKDGLNKRGLATENLHWVGNHRVNLMVKYNF